MKKILLTSFAIVSFVACTIESRAAVITFTDTLPNSDIILSNSAVAAGNIQVRNNGTTPTNGDRWVGTGFKATSNTSLDKVTFYIFNDLVNGAALGANMTFSIVSLSTQTASPSAPYTPLYSETATLPATYGLQNYITFDLASAYSLTAGSFYGVMIRFNANATNRLFNLVTSNGGGTGNIGDLFYTADQGATYTNNAGPLNFVLQTVPEPATWGLLAFSLTTIVVLRRRRQA